MRRLWLLAEELVDAAKQLEAAVAVAQLATCLKLVVLFSDVPKPSFGSGSESGSSGTAQPRGDRRL